MADDSTRTGLALVVTLLWSPLFGVFALLFALSAEDARRSGRAAAAEADGARARMLLLVALGAGFLQWAGMWGLQGLLWLL